MSNTEPQPAPEPQESYTVPPGSRLGMVLRGLDPKFALDALAAFQGQRSDEVLEKERTVVELRYGLRDGRPRQLQDIGQELGHGPVHIRRVEIRALFSLNTIRNQHRPERVFDRPQIPMIDTAYLLSASQLKKQNQMLLRGEMLAPKPRHSYPKVYQ